MFCFGIMTNGLSTCGKYVSECCKRNKCVPVCSASSAYFNNF